MKIYICSSGFLYEGASIFYISTSYIDAWKKARDKRIELENDAVVRKNTIGGESEFFVYDHLCSFSKVNKIGNLDETNKTNKTHIYSSGCSHYIKDFWHSCTEYIQIEVIETPEVKT